LFITTAKVAFVGGVRFGTGLLVNRLPGTEVGWSAPCAVGSLGISFGFMAGVEITDIIVPLKTADALNHFKKSFSLTLGGEAGFALGPIGRQGAAEAMGSTAGLNASTSLSNSRGIYGGLTLDGMVLIYVHSYPCIFNLWNSLSNERFNDFCILTGNHNYINVCCCCEICKKKKVAW
jgi:lipid-binding SYLF domain-containing protein